MTLKITHPEKPTESDKIDDNDYMLPHDIEGVLPDLSSFPGAKIRLPILIEEKTLSLGTTSVTFQNLDGNTDEEYLIVSELSIVSGGSDKNIQIKPNNQTGTSMSVIYNNDASTTVSAASRNLLQITGSCFSQDTFSKAIGRFHAKSGIIRTFFCDVYLLSTSHKSHQQYAGYWSNIADNITSLVFVVDSGGSFSGRIKLYKMVDISLQSL